MQVEFRVKFQAGAWRVLRGSTTPLHFATKDAALGAASAMASALADQGEHVLIRLQQDGAREETRRFKPEGLPRMTSVIFDPEGDLPHRV